MTSNTPQVALCPRCFCPLDIRQRFSVDVVFPAQPLVPSVPTLQVAPSQSPLVHVAGSPPSQQSDHPAPPPEPSHQPQPTTTRERSEAACHQRCSSSSSLDSAFTEFSIDTEFEAGLQALEREYFSQRGSSQPPIPASSPPIPTSSPLPAPTSSPTEFSLTLSAIPASSPSTGSSLTLSASGEPTLTPRRWVVFRGRRPGIYTTSTEAIAETDGFPSAFMLAFDNPAIADAAFERFLDDGVTPTHARGPWVVFVGRTPGVFTSYEGLCASVVGFPNNVYRCCGSVEEGQRALDEFAARNATAIPSSSLNWPNRGCVHPESQPDPILSNDDSWWCCFAGAEPGVYCGLGRLAQAFPAPGGVRQVSSEQAGWKLWTKYFDAGEVRVIPRR